MTLRHPQGIARARQANGEEEQEEKLSVRLSGSRPNFKILPSEMG